MTRCAAFVGLAVLAACAAPARNHLGLAVGYGETGLSLRPSLAASISGEGLGIEPDSATLGTRVGSVGVSVGAGF